MESHPAWTMGSPSAPRISEAGTNGKSKSLSHSETWIVPLHETTTSLLPSASLPLSVATATKLIQLDSLSQASADTGLTMNASGTLIPEVAYRNFVPCNWKGWPHVTRLRRRGPSPCTGYPPRTRRPSGCWRCHRPFPPARHSGLCTVGGRGRAGPGEISSCSAHSTPSTSSVYCVSWLSWSEREPLRSDLSTGNDPIRDASRQNLWQK